MKIIASLVAVAVTFGMVTTSTAQPEHEHHAPSAKESFSDYLWRKSDEAFHDGDYERAVKLHRSIAVIDPADTQNYGVGAWLLWSLGRGDEATAFLERGLKANPQNPEMWDESAQQFDLQKLTTRARDAYARAVELTPQSELKTPDAMMLRRRYAHALEHANDLPRAVEVWSALATDFPDDQVNKNNLARAQAKLAAGTPDNSATPTKTALLGGALLLSLFAPRLRKKS